jgi:hypothetical protein
MAPLTAAQVRNRERVERAIRVLAPGLDLLLAAGDRLSRVVERDDSEYYPPRLAHERPPLRVAARSDRG